jgi:hypothetical protein
MKIFFSEPDIEEILANAMVAISCSAEGKCNQEALLKALTLRINEAIGARLVGPFTLY